MSLCECGCGGEASPGKRFIQGHHMKGKKFSKETILKNVKSHIINKEIREGKRPAPELPFCGCGCGGRVTKPGNKYIRGHHMRVNHLTKGKTKETNEMLMMMGKKISEAKKVFFASDEGQQWLDEHNRGENHPFYGKKQSEKSKQKDRESNLGEKSWAFGKKQSEETKQKNREAHLGIKRSLESCSKQSKTMMGDGNHFYGRHHTDEVKEILRGHRMYQKFPKHHTKPELRCEKYSIKNSIPATYTGDSSFWIPKKNNGTKVCNPDFILYANGKKFVIEILGDYWHSPLLNRHVLDDDLKNKKKHYKKYRWIPIFVWESDIMQPDGEKFFLSELKKAGAI